MTQDSLTRSRQVEIAREFFPDLSDIDLMDLLWEETGYPCFYTKPHEATLRAQLTAYRAKLAQDNG